MAISHSLARIFSRTSSRNQRPTVRVACGLGASAAIVLHVTSAFAAPSVEARWTEFHKDPVRMMNEAPPKTIRTGAVKRTPMFSKKDIDSGIFIIKKNVERLNTTICDERGICLAEVIAGRALAKQNSQDFFDVNDFKGKKLVFNLEEMDSAGLRDAELPEAPWSDTYWPIYQGILGARYESYLFTSAPNESWKGLHEAVTNRGQNLKSVAYRGTPAELETLSPSEKYDLLIGDLTEGAQTYEAGYLTPHMWAEGKTYWDEKGEVEPWMGICHGWAAAAYMVKRPTNAVQAKTADGKNDLTFYPSDIKGLSSYLWAKAGVPTRFIGGRCNEKNPDTYKDSGRIKDEACFDTNPKNWHEIIVNQIGVGQRSFVMDATYDYEVWNQPIRSYSYSYFNPKTGREVKKLKTATIPIEEFTNDKFKRHRKKEVAFVVGIAMDVTYVAEANASHNVEDSDRFDVNETVSYMYDLELDKDMNIIGGEWYSNIHPDFLWNPVRDSRAETPFDSRLTGNWDPSQPLPAFWRDIAVRTAVEGKLPLATIVNALVESSRKE